MGAMFGSTALNTALIKVGLNRSIAFVVTLWTFACVNFFILKYINNKVSKAADDEELKAMAAKSSQKKRIFRTIRGGGGCASTNVHDLVLAIGGEPIERQELLAVAIQYKEEGEQCIYHLGNRSR
jgi:hypothetical protein